MSETRATPSDQELLARVPGPPPDRDAYGQLVVRHGGWLVGLVMHLTRQPRADAEDLAQEAFIRAFAAIQRPPPVTSLRPFLRTIAIRLSFNASRNARNRASLREQHLSFDRVSAPPEHADVELVQRVFQELHYAEREILVLAHVEELTLPEIAELLGIGLSAAKMRLSRARAAFLAAHDRLER